MSESTLETAPATEAAAEQPTDTPTPNESAPGLGDAGKKAIDAMKAERDAARREARANADAAKRLKEIEDEQKTEQQKLSERQALIERERDEARADGLRYRAAVKHGISEDYFDLLGSGDEEAIAGRAERIGGLLKFATENEQLKAELEALKAGKPTLTPGRPVEALKPGATPEVVSTPQDDAYPTHWLPQRQQTP